jgi:AcrR family transcriptional regulator
MATLDKKPPISLRARKSPERRGSGRPPATNGDDTRRRILEAAQVSFGAYGYKETSNRVVADLANVTAGTIYHYFSSKQHLFLTVHEEIQQDIQKTVLEAVKDQRSFQDAVQALIDVLLGLHLKHPNYSKFNAVVRTEAVRNPEISAARVDQGWRQLYQQLADLGVATGEIQRGDARMVRHVLSLIILGITQVGIELNSADFAECIRGLSRLFDGSLVTAIRQRAKAKA